MTAVVGLVGKLKNLSLSMLRQALSDWAQMASLAVETIDGKVQNLAKRPQVEAALQGPVILIETRVEGRNEGPCFFVFPLALAAHAVGKFVMLPDEVIAARAASGLDETDLSAFRELANLLCGSSNNVMAQALPGQRLSQSVDALRVWQALPDVKAQIEHLPEAELACVAVSVKVDGTAYTVHQLLPLALARTMLA